MNIKSDKPKLKISEQIAHMKRCGITFKYVTESEAEKYLLEHTYYFKLKSYAKNYLQRKDGSARKSSYIHLDFVYLQDLARLDMYFREIVFKITVDIEHLLKVQLLSDSQRNDKDDGYQIVEDFLIKNTAVKEKLTQQSSKSSYNSALIQKYRFCYPIWVFVEIISFGDLINFYEFYYRRFASKSNVKNYLWSARILRNAAAHNSCILNRLSEKYIEDKKINNSLMNTLKRNYSTLNPAKIKQYLLNPVIQDFIDILVLLKRLDKSGSLRNKRIKEVDSFLKRCRKHASYYRTNNKLLSSYNFVRTFFIEYKTK